MQSPFRRALRSQPIEVKVPSGVAVDIDLIERRLYDEAVAAGDIEPAPVHEINAYLNRNDSDNVAGFGGGGIHD